MNNQMILTLITNGKDGLVGTFNAVPDDKLNWKPLDNGRTALDLFSEAAQTTKMVAEMSQSRGETKPSRELFGQMKTEREAWTKQIALDAMQTNFAALSAAIESLSEEELSQTVTLAMGGGMTLPLAGWIMMSYRTYVSRFAQINYIQTLYGDFDSH
ncbi:hypothetical protein B1R32_1394 [Abditibacterium utsteinense]|uniref:DinB-like domain-containing protein n=1 Tax=Abditibacterium utsteinense TaxID=1960156 RepID=A0A2S8SNP5_9BACT|nr:DinB family protein [Abditibacterium utsteinense]PQV62406.1 hypothetical protein B1R32_1394 [Abditibacterium utsteinense]